MTIDKLQQLLDRCKCGVYIDVNQHRDYYQSAETYINEKIENDSITVPEELSNEIIAKMIETNTIIHIQFYPNTPIGFYYLYHYDLELALDEALSILRLMEH